MRDLGLRTEAVDPAIEVDPSRLGGLQPQAGPRGRDLDVLHAGRIDGPDFQKALDEVSPDTVLVDINAWGALNVAEAWGGPWTVFSPYTPPISSTGTPPFGPGLLPKAGPLGRLRDAVVRPLVIGAAEKTMTPRINALRADHGLAPVHSADEYFRRAPLTLVTTSEPFEYPHADWGDRGPDDRRAALGPAR